MIVAVVKAVVQSIFLIVTHNYIVYLLLEIVFVILPNAWTAVSAKRRYAFIEMETENLPKADRNSLWKNAISNFSIRIGSTVVNATDNILISAFVSTVLVGIYSNYNMIIQVFLAGTVLIEQAIMSGIGNVCVTGTVNDKQRLFRRIFYMYSVIYSVVFVGLLMCLRNFVIVWLGMEYDMEGAVVFIAILNCFLSGIHQPLESLIYADGLFRYFKIKPLLEAGINLVVSIILAQFMGMLGILLGTTISFLATTFWYDSYIACKYSLHCSAWDYIRNYGRTIVLTLLEMIPIYFVCAWIDNGISGWFGLIVKATAVVVTSGSCWLIGTCRTSEFQYYARLLKARLNR